jgi:hypothetical protein
LDPEGQRREAAATLGYEPMRPEGTSGTYEPLRHEGPDDMEMQDVRL